MGSLPLKIDSEVFKVKDSRVEAVMNGRMPVQVFALSIQPGDPFVLIKDTVHVLTETEYYALRGVLPVTVMSEKAFKYLLQLGDLSFMHRIDREFVEEVRSRIDTCPACQYRRYRDEVYKLSKKYNITLPQDIQAEAAKDPAGDATYPEVSAPIEPKVFKLLDHRYNLPDETRKPCIDCVEKHVAQAWVLGGEALQGYPEYVTMVIGHLGEAADELPDGFKSLRDTLDFCIAKTSCDRTPFVPVNLLVPHLEHARRQLNQAVEDQQDTSAGTDAYEIDFTQEMRDELARLDRKVLETFVSHCTAVDTFILGIEKTGNGTQRVGWEGAMGCAADCIAAAGAQKTACMIRNRRLLFVFNPLLSKDSGYGMDELRDCALKLCDDGSDG